jgi:hypothetical protein
MAAALVDHLWQSLWCLVAVVVMAAALRGASAQVRVWLWRSAAAKFVVPFALLQSMGAWLGFPVMHASEPAPASLVALIQDLRPWLAPASNHELQGAPLLAAMLLLLGICGGWVAWILRQLRVESSLARWQAAHEFDESAPATRPVGFVRAAVITMFLILAVSAPTITGAVDDRQHRHELMLANARVLREAAYQIRVAPTGAGHRWRLHAAGHGVAVRNVSVQELIAIAFGVPPSAVMSNQTVSGEASDPYDYWMISPRYDLEITGSVLEPERFESYALHALITRVMAEKFGIEIHVNGRCQAPCGRWALPARTAGS